MRHSRAIILAGAVCALSVVAGCDQVERWLTARDMASPSPSGPAGERFVHAVSEDVSGYYLPREEVRMGRWRLDHVFLGQASDFEAWAAGRREGVFAPVMLEIVDPESPLVQTELGPVRSGRVRVLPVRYAVTDDRVTFSGRSDVVGDVTFEGRLDLDALADARRSLGDERPVLTGTLTSDGRAAPVSLRWWAGD